MSLFIKLLHNIKKNTNNPTEKKDKETTIHRKGNTNDSLLHEKTLYLLPFRLVKIFFKVG